VQLASSIVVQCKPGYSSTLSWCMLVFSAISR